MYVQIFDYAAYYNRFGKESIIFRTKYISEHEYVCQQINLINNQTIDLK